MKQWLIDETVKLTAEYDEALSVAPENKDVAAALREAEIRGAIRLAKKAISEYDADKEEA